MLAVRYSARSVASGLFLRTSRLESTPIDGDEERGQHDAGDVLAGEERHGISSA